MNTAVCRLAARRVLAITGLAGICLLPAGHALAGTKPASRGDIGVKLDTVPASERNNPIDQAYIVRWMRRGTVARAVISVLNDTPATQHIQVYPAAAQMSGLVFEFASGTTANELTTWTRLSQHLLVMKPFTEAPVEVAITVPRDASPGRNVAVIWAQLSSGHGQITMVNRVGIRMYITIGRGGPPPPGFRISSATAGRSPSGRPEVLVRVRNTGGTPLSLVSQVRLVNGPGGVSIANLPLASGTTMLGVGTVSTLAFAGSKSLPNGPWTAVLSMRGGFIQHTLRVRLTFPTPGTRLAGLMPVAIGVLVAVPLVTGWLFVGRRRRARRVLVADYP